jgi:uncharacterized membrane protein YtjA (UPF0391 family)
MAARSLDSSCAKGPGCTGDAPRRAHGTIPPSGGYSRVRRQKQPFDFGEFSMLHWAIVFLIIALAAGVLGFGGIASVAVGFARILFFIFLVLFLLSLLQGVLIH